MPRALGFLSPEWRACAWATLLGGYPRQRADPVLTPPKELSGRRLWNGGADRRNEPRHVGWVATRGH